MTIEELEAAAMKLAPQERERLGRKLLGSVPADLAYEAEWVAEIDRRTRQIEAGDGTVESSESMFHDALRRLS